MIMTKNLWFAAGALALFGGPGIARAAGPVTFTTIYSFSGQPGVGVPERGLLEGPNGVLYGISNTFNETAPVNGLVFTLTPSAGGSAWSVADIHDFANKGTSIGVFPSGRLSMDSLGRLYGVTSEGGVGCPNDKGCGTVFKLTPRDPGGVSLPWNETTLYRLTTHVSPGGPLALDASNPLLTSLYGVAGGGAFNKGAVYRVQVPQ